MASDSLYTHYLEYILSPPVLLTLWILLIPVLLERYKDKIFAPSLQPFKPEGCFRLGLRKKSNLSGQYHKHAGSRRQNSLGTGNLTGTPRIKALFTYPLKSCRGVELAASEVAPTGLKYDRLFTFAQYGPEKKDKEKSQWCFMTQRDFPKLALLKTELWVPDPRAAKEVSADAKTSQGKRGRKQPRDEASLKKPNLGEMQKRLEEDWAANGGCMVVHFPHKPAFNPFGLRTETVELCIPLVPTQQRVAAKSYSFGNLSIWKDYPRALDMTSEINPMAFEKLKTFLGVHRPLALFRVSDRDKRAVVRSLPKDRPDDNFSLGFADAFPVNILNLASVRAVDESMPANVPMKDSLDARRFRANIFITGPSPFAEDTWKRITIGRCIAPRSEAARDRSPVRDPANTMIETDGLYHVACRTARCKLPNTDPDTGVQDKNQPSTALMKTRVVDAGAKPHSVLGLHMIPLFPQGILRVGDEVEVLERGEHVYEKMFK